MTGKTTEILHILRDVLRFHRALGITEYPDSHGVQRFMQLDSRPGVQQAERPGHVSMEAKNPDTGIENLENEVSTCTLCPLSRDPRGRIPGKGRRGCRLMIVGDWSFQAGTFSAGTLFGTGEDDMLWKMIAAIELQPDQVYVTNCIKCCPTDPGIIDRKCEESCFSFLAREIAAVDPHVICAMGEMPVRVLMGRKEPLARLRGRFGSYRYQAGRSVLIMPTYHPRFLIQHQEMKKATWNDLLAIKRKLAESQ